MDLTIYDIIQGAWVTEEAGKQNRAGKLVLLVHMHANKPLIAQALRKLFNVEAEKISVLVRKGKTRKVGRREVHGRDVKKAIIRLKPGYSLNVVEQQTEQASKE